MKKIASLFIALIMLLSLSVTAFANEREVVIGTVHRFKKGKFLFGK